MKTASVDPDLGPMVADALACIRAARVLVVGDVMLDRYWHGAVDRISPEAPVPVVSVQRADERPGGAANVARNVSALGAHCALLAVTGNDPEADRLEHMLDESGITCHFVRDALVGTTVKLRVISMHQQLIRLDFDAPGSKDSLVKLLDRYLASVAEHGAVVISDYGKGGLGRIAEMIEAAGRHGVPALVDPKGDDWSGYRGAALVTPNRKEFEHVVGRCLDPTELEKRAKVLAGELSLGGILITRGEEGMMLVPREGASRQWPARAREVFDVTGAGDTVIGTLAAALAGGVSLETAVCLSNLAAGIVVGKLGAAQALPEEILGCL